MKRRILKGKPKIRAIGALQLKTARSTKKAVLAIQIKTARTAQKTSRALNLQTSALKKAEKRRIHADSYGTPGWY